MANPGRRSGWDRRLGDERRFEEQEPDHAAPDGTERRQREDRRVHSERRSVPDRRTSGWIALDGLGLM